MWFVGILVDPYNSLIREPTKIMPETARTSPVESKFVRFERVAFDDIPGQSKLFRDYLRTPDALSDFYPHAVARHEDLIAFADRVLNAYTTDRTVLCDLLDQAKQIIWLRTIYDRQYRTASPGQLRGRIIGPTGRVVYGARCTQFTKLSPRFALPRPCGQKA
jgi:hypothetical protein